MKSITSNALRVGRFTSSEIHKLMTVAKNKVDFGAPALNYIAEKNLERKLGRSLNVDKSSRAIAWGHFNEKRVHELLPMSYQSVGNITVPHPTIECWSGSPDHKNEMEKVVADTKCFEPKKFAEYVDVLMQSDIAGVQIFKEENAKEYWQLISNAIILGYDYIEPIVYMPYESELEEIRDMARTYAEEDSWKYNFIWQSAKEELPYLPDGGYYRNLNIFRFKVDEADKNMLIQTVMKAEQQLITIPQKTTI